MAIWQHVGDHVSNCWVVRYDYIMWQGLGTLGFNSRSWLLDNLIHKDFTDYNVYTYLPYLNGYNL